ncbi:MAG: glycosyltransferase family 1 protein [Bryobacteraceae bacterium]|jgi:glycosyltransferase involved in cell wall biosynthesis
MSLRIGVNALYLIPGGVGGTEIYLRNLLNAAAAGDRANTWVVFTNRETGADLVPRAPNFVHAPQRLRAAVRPARILWEQLALPVVAARRHLDVLFNPGFTCPLLCPCPNVTVFHDLQHKRHPEYFRWFDLPAWQFLLWGAAHRSQALIADSAATSDDLRRYYGVDSTVIHLGVEPELFALAERREPKRFLLCLSTLHPHKNLDRLVRAYAGLGRTDFHLVIAGLRGFHAKQLEALIASLGVSEHARITGWVPREEIRELLRTAWAVIQPSTFEGFGMPVLEAMAAGVPVACSSIPPFRETTGGHVTMFDATDEAAIREAMLRLLDAPPDTAAARAHARQFTWERTARETIAVLENAAAR